MAQISSDDKDNFRNETKPVTTLLNDCAALSDHSCSAFDLDLIIEQQIFYTLKVFICMYKMIS